MWLDNISPNVEFLIEITNYYWFGENPHLIELRRLQVRFGFIVWCGMTGNNYSLVLSLNKYNFCECFTLFVSISTFLNNIIVITAIITLELFAFLLVIIWFARLTGQRYLAMLQNRIISTMLEILLNDFNYIMPE